MSIYQTITFQPWTIGALDRSKHAMVFCSTQEGPIFRAHTWNEQVELYRAPSHEKIAQYYTGSSPGVALNLITVPSPTLAGKKLLTTHSPTHKTLHIGTSDYQWFATRVSPAGPTSYELYTPESVPLAQLRIEDRHVKLDLRLEVKTGSRMCDGIIAAIIFMSVTQDAWLDGGNMRL